MKIRVTKPALTEDVDGLVILTRSSLGDLVLRVRIGDHTTERLATAAEAQVFNDAVAADLVALGWTREPDPPPEQPGTAATEPDLRRSAPPVEEPTP